MANRPKPELTVEPIVVVDLALVTPVLANMADMSSLQEMYQYFDTLPTDTLQQTHDLLLFDIGTTKGKIRNGAVELHTVLCPYLQQRKKAEHAKADHAHLN